MKAQRLLAVIELYKSHLIGMGLSPQEFDESQYGRLITGTPLLEHCLWMLTYMEKILKRDPLEQDPEAIEKALGWMGFVQGCLAATQTFTIKELRDQSRTPK